MYFRSLVLFIFLLCLLPFPIFASQQVYFEPLQDTLTRFQIHQIPTADLYPDVPALAVLSFDEYRQIGIKHERTTHKIIKVLTPAGKEYATVKIPCFSECRVRARTIKPDGTIVALPEKDIIRTERLTNYSSPYHFVHFAMPSVQPGDLMEYKAEIVYPYPFLLGDFRFAEPYPIWKGVFVLSHPQDYSYTYSLRNPPGTSRIDVSRENANVLNISYVRSTFIAEKVAAVSSEPFSPAENRTQPGIRIIVERQGGRRYEAFDSWFHYGDLISEQTDFSSPGTLQTFDIVKKAAQNSQNPESIIREVYTEIERIIEITDETLLSSGFEFQRADKTMEKKSAAPHDFALLLAVCFRSLQWTSDLILVNSHDREESSEKNVFPQDLDMVFLNVKVKDVEFLLDCNRNGLPPFILSSKAMNRFALGIPLFHTKTGFSKTNDIYLTTMPYRSGNNDHIEMTAVPEGKTWSVSFRWTLEGEYRAPFAVQKRQMNEEDFRRKLLRFVRSRISAEDLSEIEHRFLPDSFVITGKASFSRKKTGGNLELIQNGFWKPDFAYRSYFLDNTTSSILLPAAGQISSSFQIPLAGGNSTLPEPVKTECKPVVYQLDARQEKTVAKIEEKITMSDLEVKPSSFPEFRKFLDRYHANHYWTIILEQSP